MNTTVETYETDDGPVEAVQLHLDNGVAVARWAIIVHHAGMPPSFDNAGRLHISTGPDEWMVAEDGDWLVNHPDTGLAVVRHPAFAPHRG